LHVAGVVLAAGFSSRMGKEKASLPWGNGIVLGEVVLNLLQAGVAPVIVVSNPKNDPVIEPLMAGIHPVAVTVNHNPEKGMASSLAVGVEVLADLRPNAVVMALVDQPGIRAETIADVASRIEDKGVDIVIPRFQGKKGHPVAFRYSLASDIMEIAGAGTVRDVFHRYAASTLLLDTDDPWVARDIDTHEDYERWRWGD